MRRLNRLLIGYGLVVIALTRILPPKYSFYFVCVFFLWALLIASKAYKGTIATLRKDFGLRFEKSDGEKNALSKEIEKIDIHITDLRNRELTMVSLYEITKKMSEKLTFNEIFAALSSFLKENFMFRKSELLILKDEDGKIGIDKAYKLYRIEEDEAGDERSDYFEILRIFSENKKEIYVPAETGAGFAAIPLLSENKFVGILTVEDLPRPDFERLLIVAAQFALEIKKVLLYETVEELAITDGLTGLYTRRYFFERLTEELNRAKRHGFKVAFLMIDIDDFKKCNDAHGHLVGDVILKDSARIIKENSREIDLTARYGGEEFSVILPETDKKGAMMAAERIRKKIEENVFKAYDEKLKITVSAGLAVYPDDSCEIVDIVEKADEALYAAKSSGKNIVCEYKG